MICYLRALGLTLSAFVAITAPVPSAVAAEATFMTEHELYPATVSSAATTTQKIVTDLGFVLTCIESEETPGLTTSGAIEEKGTSLDLTPTFTNCHATVLQIPLTIESNGCDLRFTAGTTVDSNHSEGSLHIVGCDSGAKGITLTVGSEGHTCHIDLPEGTPTAGAVNYENVSTESGVRHIKMITNVSLPITYTGGTQCEGGTNEGVAGSINYEGTSTATAGGEGLTVE